MDLCSKNVTKSRDRPNRGDEQFIPAEMKNNESLFLPNKPSNIMALM